MQPKKKKANTIVSLLTNNELSRREIKKIISFIIASKILKYLKINLTKEVNT